MIYAQLAVEECWRRIEEAVNKRDPEVLKTLTRDLHEARKVAEFEEQRKQVAALPLRKFKVRCVKDAYAYFYGEVEAQTAKQALDILERTGGEPFIDFDKEPEVSADFDEHFYEVDVSVDGAEWEDYRGREDVGFDD